MDELLKFLLIITLAPIALVELLQIGVFLAEAMSESAEWLSKKRGNSHED